MEEREVFFSFIFGSTHRQYLGMVQYCNSVTNNCRIIWSYVGLECFAVRPSANVAIYTRHVERKAFDVTSLSSGDLIFQGKNHIHAKKVTSHQMLFSRRVLCKSQRLRSALK